MSTQKNLKRLIRKYEFLLEDWEDVEEIGRTANQEMLSGIYKIVPPEMKESEYTEPDIKKTTEDEGNTGDPSDILLKKLFRKIVVKCHPDKIEEEVSESEKGILKRLYENSIIANDEKNWALMLITAIKLDVDVPEEAINHLDKIEKEISNLTKKIDQTIGSVQWKYYHSEENERKIMLDRYIELIKKAKNSKKKLILCVGQPGDLSNLISSMFIKSGLEIGDCEMRGFGTSDWSLVSGKTSVNQNLRVEEFKWDFIVYFIMDPKDIVGQIAGEVNTNERYLEFMECNNIKVNSNPIISAIDLIYKCDQLSNELNHDFILKIEDLDKISEMNSLIEKMNERGIKIERVEIPENIGISKNSDPIKYTGIPVKYKIKLNYLCRKYGYSLIN